MKIEELVKKFYVENRGKHATVYDILPSFLLKHGDMQYPLISVNDTPCCRIILANRTYELYSEFDLRTRYDLIEFTGEVEVSVHRLQLLGKYYIEQKGGL